MTMRCGLSAASVAVTLEQIRSFLEASAAESKSTNPPTAPANALTKKHSQ